MRCNGGGGIIANESCRGSGSGGILGQKIFRFGGSEMLFSALCHEIYRRKIDLEYENGKQLQVTIIKITVSKENKSIQRLDVSGPTGPRGEQPPYSPASQGSGDRSLISYPYLTA